MIRTFARRAAVAAMPLIALPVITLAAAPGAAFASPPSTTVQFINQASLQSDGSILFTLHVSCLPSAFGPTGFAGVEADQPSGFGINNTITFTCDGKKHMITVDVPAATGSFTTGTVAALGFVNNSTGVSQATTTAGLKVS